MLSVLDLVPVGSGSTPADAMRNSVELARLAERLGYLRYWFAEHHGMPGIASSVPELLIEHIASKTTAIRVGAGGIMLPSHAPLRVAEVFHTLEALHPGRIDLGLGRAPGTDPVTSQALRPADANLFPQQLTEMLTLSRGGFPDDHPLRAVRVVPGAVGLPPVWLLGSSGASARFAGSLGVGYAFARHFSPSPPGPPIAAYLESFRPSAQFPEPHAILGVSVVCAETDTQAEHMASSADLMWVRHQRGEFSTVPSPEEAQAYPYSPAERISARQNRSRHFVGTPAAVASMIREALADSGAHEAMVTSMVHSHADRLRSYELLAAEFRLAGAV